MPFASLAADVGFVSLNHLALAAERPSSADIVCGFTQAMEQKPRGLVVRAEHPVELVRRHALFARCH
jgi:hypothetical protein